MQERWSKKKVLITIRTYPAPSAHSIEVSCTAGIDETGHWIRLYPIPYRFLNPDQRFSKYQYIEASVAKSESDFRRESYKLNIDSIQIVPDSKLNTDKGWEARRLAVKPLISPSICYLRNERDTKQEPTLGLFKPKTITGLKIKPTTSTWSEAELAKLQQSSMFGNAPINELQKLPFVFSYGFKCDDINCKGHEMMCTDWEIGASYLAWRIKYGANWESKFRQTYETEMILKRDTHFFVGTLRSNPGEWIIVGLFYPPKIEVQNNG